MAGSGTKVPALGLDVAICEYCKGGQESTQVGTHIEATSITV